MDGQQQSRIQQGSSTKFPFAAASLSGLCLGFSGGAAVVLLLPFLPPFWPYWSSACLVAVLLCCLPAGMAYVRAVLLAALLGASWQSVFAARQLSLWLPVESENRVIEIDGYLQDFAAPTERGWRFDLQAPSLQGRVRLSWSEAAPPRADCHYRLRVKLKRPRGLLNDDLFDYQAWLLQAGYRATGYVVAVLACEQRAVPRQESLRHALDAWLLQQAISPQAQAALRALLLGNDSSVTQQDWQLLRDSGTIHLLSVSGLHISLVAGLCYWLVLHICRWLVWPCRVRPAAFWAGGAAAVVALGYGLLAGFSVATERSVWMVLLAVLLRCFYWRVSVLLVLWLAMLLVLLRNPLSLLSCGFWFSFAATAVLLQYSENVVGQSVVAERRKLFFHIRAALVSQLLLFVFLAPLLLYVYGSQPLLSLPFNLLAVPWVSLVSLPLGLLSVLLHYGCEDAASWLLGLAAWSLDVYWRCMAVAVDVSHGLVWRLPLNSLAVLSLILLLLWCCTLLPLSRGLRAAGLLLAVTLLLAGGERLPPAVAQIDVLDVGQGLAVVVRTARHTLVYDSGDRPSASFDVGRDIVAPVLQRRGVERLNMLIVSHADRDHAGGVRSLLAAWPAGQCWSGMPEQLLPVAACLPCRAGMRWRWDGVDFRILSPGETAQMTDNNRSCVLMISAGSQRALLSGDIESAVERQLLQHDVRAHLLLAPHHGSRTSSSVGFLAAVAPQWIAVSSGYLNRFHHPATQVTERYQQYGAHWHNTAVHGGLHYTLSAQGLTMRSSLCGQPRWWRQDRIAQACLADPPD